jgi:hypothetical protein
VDCGGYGKMKTGDRVGVSDTSEENAKKDKCPSIVLANVGGSNPFICVHENDGHLYPDGDYRIQQWKYGVELPEPKLRPWKLEDNVVGRVIRWKSGNPQYAILKADESYVWIPGVWYDYEFILNNCEWLDGDEWRACGVEE